MRRKQQERMKNKKLGELQILCSILLLLGVCETGTEHVVAAASLTDRERENKETAMSDTKVVIITLYDSAFLTNYQISPTVTFQVGVNHLYYLNNKI